MELGGIAKYQGETDQAISIAIDPVEVRLKRRKENLLNQVADIDSALKLLEENPKVLDILNVLRRVGI